MSNSGVPPLGRKCGERDTECVNALARAVSIQATRLSSTNPIRINKVSGVLISENLLEIQRTIKIAYIMEFKSFMLRVGSDHLGRKFGLHGVFRMLGRPNVVTVCWIGHIGLYVVEPRKVRLPVDIH